MDPQKITELANLLRQNGDKILSSEFTLTLSGSLLRALNDSFTLIADTEIIAGAGTGTTHHHHHNRHSHHHQQHQQTFQVVKPINAKSSVFPDLQLLHDFVQKTALLKLTYFPSELYFEGAIDIAKFRALRRLEVHKISINQVVGIQPLRGQLQHLICVKSLASVDDIITRCGGDNSNGFVWNELQTADFSYNSLRSVDTALEFAQHLQHLNLRHNKLISVAAIKWLPHLKTLDLSYNCLTYLPQFHMEACKKLQQLNISNNYVEELLDVAKLDALTSLDLSDNCLLEHSQLLPLSALMTLTMLNLQGNPLSCNPKHRQATAQYLHKNTASMKFVLDFELLSKSEKALTGSQKWRYIGSHRVPRSGPVSINSSRTSINTSDGSQFSSFGSQPSGSIRGRDYASETEQHPAMDVLQSSKKQNSKKSVSKIRRADISEDTEDVAEARAILPPPKPQPEPEECATDSSHLETKKQIETLRLTYGNEWLKTGNAELMLGIESPQPSEKERNASRQQFNEFLGEFSAPMQAKKDDQAAGEPLNVSSTPTNNSSKWGASFNNTLTPIKTESQEAANQTLYETCNESGETNYESIASSTKEQSEEQKPAEAEQKQVEEEEDHSQDKHKQLLSLYASGSNAIEEEEPVSDMEPDEETYIVYHEHKPSVPLFLTISSNFIREKDTLSERTKTKWSLKILESCERLKSNTLRINFDTLRKDKQERIYCVENTLCQELEKKLRDILSQRDLTEMNIKIYRCVNCLIQFSMEQKIKRYKTEQLRCPDCRSVHVAEVTDLSTSLDKASAMEVAAEPKLSPALIVEESTPVGAPQTTEETNSIVALSRLKTTAKNTPKRRSLMQATKSSANSLNESSSCSKITNSQSSFDSNQSVVGSSNTDRDLEFRANESDVDIISNPSQSSIEVLDPNCVQSASRKTSEDRRISQLPHLQALHDETQSFIEREFGQQMRLEEAAAAAAAAAPPPPVVAQVQLTESSSSGSVTDSICTTYEQQKEAIKESSNNNHLKKAEEVAALPFASVFQSTNLLMSSSKKLIEAEASSAASTASGVQPYKFNYSNFNDIDHRLKLYFYQTKFKEQDEHFKWLAKGRIYNEQTQTLSEGLIVMSTCKLYLMEAFAAPHDDVSKWLRQVVSVTVDRLVAIGVLPWKLGLSFSLRDWGGFVLLLQDMLRTDSLLLYMQDNALPTQCKVLQQSSPALKSVCSEPVKMCAILGSCQTSCNEEKGLSFEPCLLLSTDSQMQICGNGKWDWLSSKSQELDLQPGLTQPMSNLVDVERLTDVEYVINFIDETENKCEMWKLNFETYANAECCLNAVGQTWEQLFGVPFSYAGT
ncbi:serine/threonine-protein kinase 11-interacting protein isoform X1 [Drosophila subobscura]|uniref:serine/threonine-protein kinase 11-interacting protein isoform X1 n=1 Tax=Drosophila subobscura TaxID=7241 RepID=UPI00155A8E63|nr:serine/threonine-protein kinase 11-interacting protein isoform X1 [Drosophila subobscura]